MPRANKDIDVTRGLSLDPDTFLAQHAPPAQPCISVFTTASYTPAPWPASAIRTFS